MTAASIDPQYTAAHRPTTASVSTPASVSIHPMGVTAVNGVTGVTGVDRVTGVDGAAGAPGVTVLDVVVPVYNEEQDLVACIERLHEYLGDHLPYPFQITVADNASTDQTWPIALDLADRLSGVRAVHLDLKGRGRALRLCWGQSDALVRAYMDVDLSTDLAALLPLVAPLLSGHSDVAIGSRLSRTSRVIRGTKRELISRSYNLLLRGALGASFSDAQCGFKAIRGEVADRLLPLVEDTAWFFDTELLVLAERTGLRIHEVPVDWIDDADSRVDLVSTAMADLRGIVRLGRGLASGSIPVAALRSEVGRGPLQTQGVSTGLARHVSRFAVIGVASTVAYVVLFWLLRGQTGAQAANLIALVVTAVANTAANRRLTFGVRGRAGSGRTQLQGMLVFGVGLALTSGALHMLSVVSAHPPRWIELSVLVAANALATVVRFVLLRHWVFRRQVRPEPGH